MRRFPEEEYGIRYPGDEYVDVIGFDMYDMDPVDDKEEVWFGNLRKQLEISTKVLLMNMESLWQ